MYLGINVRLISVDRFSFICNYRCDGGQAVDDVWNRCGHHHPISSQFTILSELAVRHGASMA